MAVSAQLQSDDWLQDFAPYVDLKHKETRQVKRFSKVSLSDYFDIRHALKTDYVHDSELSAQSAEDGDNG
jgi:hypothetical protein